MSDYLDELNKMIEVMIHSKNDDHFHKIGIEAIGLEPNKMIMKSEYHDDLIGNPDTGVIHGGVITSLLDTTCGFAAATALGHLGLTPTIDLRIDYMRSAKPGLPIIAEAEVYRNTKTVIFTKGIAHQGDKDKPIAHAIGNFVNLGAEIFKDLRESVLLQYEKLGLNS